MGNYRHRRGGGQFAAQLVRSDQAKLHAVASRSGERAKTIASDWGAKVGHGSYAALVADPEIDIVYVATPASKHRDHCLLALNAGKPVLTPDFMSRHAAPM
jgi:predicted dehydrogenase